MARAKRDPVAIVGAAEHGNSAELVTVTSEGEIVERRRIAVVIRVIAAHLDRVGVHGSVTVQAVPSAGPIPVGVGVLVPPGARVKGVVGIVAVGVVVDVASWAQAGADQLVRVPEAIIVGVQIPAGRNLLRHSCATHSTLTVALR